MTAYATAYKSLLLDFLPRPIRTERDYNRVCRQVQHLMALGTKLSRAESEMLEVLSLLVDQYEAAHFPLRDATQSEVLTYLINARGVSNAEVARATGIARSLITDVLAGRRKISTANIAKLAEYFRVSPAVFSSEA